jgi:hypothetical protein
MVRENVCVRNPFFKHLCPLCTLPSVASKFQILEAASKRNHVRVLGPKNYTNTLDVSSKSLFALHIFVDFGALGRFDALSKGYVTGEMRNWLVRLEGILTPPWFTLSFITPSSLVYIFKILIPIACGVVL